MSTDNERTHPGAVVSVAVALADAAERETVCAMLRRYADEHRHIAFDIYEMDQASQLLASYSAFIDLLVLDGSRGADGMEMARSIRRMGGNPAIAFIADDLRDAVLGYEVDACGYIMRPRRALREAEARYRECAAVFDRCMDRLARSGGKTLLFAQCGRCLRVPVDDVVYVESRDRLITVHTVGGDFLFKDSIARLGERLSSFGFAQCSSGCLVNLRHVSAVNGDVCVVRRSLRLPIARRRRSLFRQAVSEYFTPAA
ncbi:DNA-binding response regulator [Bifidobacterium lemurum]|uniref:DNA-binding response regulator n=1 Tax=Bifidobacterium lemurum TaxID=1603886 RepID=A0A261FKN4_9BIFI|nr:LytTR family DNA-binding domain-containing protein [Bifidobacterium lemurum]OZG59732.1 DNA-binding response regulator [Bifidobacterium lemurum]QOL35026.1 response regulator transcription factor [Bifidobacterium lemurum]